MMRESGIGTKGKDCEGIVRDRQGGIGEGGMRKMWVGEGRGRIVGEGQVATLEVEGVH